LIGNNKEYDRGNLSLHYFPADKMTHAGADFLTKAQTRELNASYLSYLCVPVKRQVLLLYSNESFKHGQQSTTDNFRPNGDALDDGLVFGNQIIFLIFKKLGK
jgi:hypothetical protein